MPGRPNRPLFDYLQDRRESQERREQKRSEYVAPSVGASETGPAEPPASSVEPKPVPRPEVTVVKPPVRMTMPRPTSPSAFPRPISRESLAEPATTPAPTSGPARPSPAPTPQGLADTIASPSPQGPAPATATPESGAAPRGEGDSFLGIPPRVLIIAVGVALLVALGGYMVGYRRGESALHVPSADPTLVNPPIVNNPTPTPTPAPTPGPIGGKVSTKPEVIAKAPQPAPPQTNESTTKPQTVGKDPLEGSGRLLTPDGRSNADPREAGLNYLILMGDKPGLAEEDAGKAIAFLAREGVQVVGVPVGAGGGGVERGAGGANTSTRYSLVALPGFPGRASEAEKSRMAKLQADVARIGQRWRKEERGPADFKDTYWRKHDGR